jgi:hypothetical protein
MSTSAHKKANSSPLADAQTQNGESQIRLLIVFVASTRCCACKNTRLCPIPTTVKALYIFFALLFNYKKQLLINATELKILILEQKK